MDHHQAGVWLTQKWQLPADITAVLEYHHYSDYRGDFWHEALITGYCSRATRKWLLGHEDLLPEEDEILTLLGIQRYEMQKVAEKCHSKLEEVEGIASEMAR